MHLTQHSILWSNLQPNWDYIQLRDCYHLKDLHDLLALHAPGDLVESLETEFVHWFQPFEPILALLCHGLPAAGKLLVNLYADASSIVKAKNLLLEFKQLNEDTYKALDTPLAQLMPPHSPPRTMQRIYNLNEIVLARAEPELWKHIDNTITRVQYDTALGLSTQIKDNYTLWTKSATDLMQMRTEARKSIFKRAKDELLARWDEYTQVKHKQEQKHEEDIRHYTIRIFIFIILNYDL